MGGGFDRKIGGSSLIQDTFGSPGSALLSPGKQTLTEQLPLVQRTASSSAPEGNAVPEGGAVQQTAAQGVASGGGPLPHGATIQQLFGRHDVSGIQAHVGGPAAAATRAIGAEAYATGSHVAFTGSPSLHTAAHEAAHVVQQRGGCS
jgi:hypothetical protein